MDQIAVIVDGSETPAADGSVGFAVGAIRQPRRPVAGLAIAVLTAVVTMGALGPRIPDGDGAGAAACVAAADAVAAAVASPTGDGAAVEAPPASPLAWWLLPQVAEWVDPATGKSVQQQVNPPFRVVHDRRLDR